MNSNDFQQKLSWHHLPPPAKESTMDISYEWIAPKRRMHICLSTLSVIDLGLPNAARQAILVPASFFYLIIFFPLRQLFGTHIHTSSPKIFSRIQRTALLVGVMHEPTIATGFDRYTKTVFKKGKKNRRRHASENDNLWWIYMILPHPSTTVNLINP